MICIHACLAPCGVLTWKTSDVFTHKLWAWICGHLHRVNVLLWFSSVWKEVALAPLLRVGQEGSNVGDLSIGLILRAYTLPESQVISWQIIATGQAWGSEGISALRWRLGREESLLPTSTWRWPGLGYTKVGSGYRGKLSSGPGKGTELILSGQWL